MNFKLEIYKNKDEINNEINNLSYSAKIILMIIKIDDTKKQ